MALTASHPSSLPSDNAEVEYVDAQTGEVLHVGRFYDPGLDPSSWLAQETQLRYGSWQPALSYRCGRPL